MNPVSYPTSLPSTFSICNVIHEQPRQPLSFQVKKTRDGKVDWRVIKSDKEVEEVQERADRTGKGKTSCGAEEGE
ncbi:uncharacterized protein MONOS_15784 [Monocercomonoides exilis]|uniref:uncharacterized protein n=1 Tax=Monocercomonoides exilis TaxID=2049356 RepID=UPI003559BDC7|nr:hypothetical protein MONOS_15784 [Monocercomonoides exilis]|eukprot:MONOS_15784.1-p1 / transcript=MONOS_15784.1 / gene=MONOS_15784 / organism=Monocercomonoides_exilis_PA203 / gene_product=unspecified product / transcript_product=unspecified product / location=Mono_scaffold01356:1738-2076(+) / protein_length=75 / sequence_SO=supercontig / SO=protein_coding / is_pseudo=false